MTRSGYCEEPEDTIEFLIGVISREKCTNFIALPPLLNAFMERQVDAFGFISMHLGPEIFFIFGFTNPLILIFPKSE